MKTIIFPLFFLFSICVKGFAQDFPIKIELKVKERFEIPLLKGHLVKIHDVSKNKFYNKNSLGKVVVAAKAIIKIKYKRKKITLKPIYKIVTFCDKIDGN